MKIKFLPAIGSGGGGGGGGSSGDQIFLGNPSDGTYTDGLLDLSPYEVIADAIDDINETLKYLAPEPPEPLSGSLNLNVTLKSGYVANYSNLGTLSAGQFCDFLINTNTFNGTTPNTDRFSDADSGTLDLYKNDAQVDSFDLNVPFNENERENCQSYPPQNSSNGYITVLSVCCYNNFPKYQKGQARVNFNSSLIDVGYNKFQLKHNLGSSEHSTNILEVYYDDAVRPIITSFNTSFNTENIKWLSGIKFYTLGTVFDVAISANGIFDKTYVQRPVVLSGNALNIKEIAWNDANASGFNTPPNYDDVWNYSGQINLDKAIADDEINFTVYGRDPFGNGTPKDNTFSKHLVNTYNEISTDTHEYFVDEKYRLPLGDYDTVPSNITNQWDSTAALTNGNAQVYLNSLVYPSINFNDGTWNPTQESGRDYSGFTGDQVYIRAIRDLSTPRNSGSLHIVGIDWNAIENDNVDLFLKLPSKTGWLDLSKPYNAATFTGADGDGCMTSHSQAGDILIINWSSGIYSTADSGYMYVLKIVLKMNTISINEIWDFE